MIDNNQLVLVQSSYFLVQFVFVFSLVQYERPKYLNYTFPLWGELLGWALALSSMLAIPAYMIWLIVRSITRPNDDQRHLSIKEVCIQKRTENLILLHYTPM